MKPRARAIRRAPEPPYTLDGELRAEPVEGSLASLYVLHYLDPTGASRFIALVEGSREEVAVTVLRLALRMKLHHDSGRRDHRPGKRHLNLARPREFTSHRSRQA